MRDFFRHKARPKPRISGSPSGAMGTMTGVGAVAAGDFLRKNIATPRRTDLWHQRDHKLLWLLSR
jgi:hypothetical protein